jgi:hypothetical protein
MNCIHDDIIQKYIDREANLEEVTNVENHILNCNKCVIRIENQRKLATNIKKAINLLAKDTIEIPKFEIPTRNIKKHSLTAKRLNYIIAAACFLLFVIVITQKKKIKNNDEIIIEIGSVMDVDANRPVSQLPLVISIIDSKGTISEYFIK